MTLTTYLRLLSVSSALAVLTSPALAAEDKVLNLEAGQRLTLVLPDANGADEAARETFMQGLIRLSADLELKEEHSFAVASTIIGEHQPQALGIYSWPDKQSSMQLRTHSEYQAQLAPIKADAWSQIHTLDVDLAEPLSITFKEDRSYTIALAWIANQSMFDSYAVLSQPVRDALGAKTLVNLPVADFEAVGANFDRQPDRVVIIEWLHPSHPQAYRYSPAVQNNPEIVQSAFEGINWYQLKHWEGYGQ